MIELKSLLKNDLNLLVTLYVLLQEKSVTRAAERLFVTQPAISKSLSRLREVFDDPLFTRSSRGLIPTPMAEALLPRLEKLLIEATDLFIPEAFDPESYHGVINITVTESLDMMFIPQLVAALRRIAPGMTIVTRSHLDNQLEALEDGSLDFTINLQYAELSETYQSDRLLTDVPVVLTRIGHPLEHKVIDESHLELYPRVSIHLPDFQRFSLFAEQGGSEILGANWPIAFETENLVTALATISYTDFVMPAPSMLTLFSNQDLPFCSIRQRVLNSRQFVYCLVSHQRTARSATHQWLRKFILDQAVLFENKLNEIRREHEL